MKNTYKSNLHEAEIVDEARAIVRSAWVNSDFCTPQEALLDSIANYLMMRFSIALLYATMASKRELIAVAADS